MNFFNIFILAATECQKTWQLYPGKEQKYFVDLNKAFYVYKLQKYDFDSGNSLSTGDMHNFISPLALIGAEIKVQKVIRLLRVKVTLTYVEMQ